MDYIDVVMTCPPGPNGEFVETEAPDGTGVGTDRGLQWIEPKGDEKLWRLRIPASVFIDSSRPITASMLRDDWLDDPNLTEDEASLLENLADETLQDALDAAFGRHEDTWFQILDEVRSAATRALLGVRRELGL